VREIQQYYDTQSDDEAAAEIEAGFNRRTDTLVLVPKKLVPAIKELIAKHKRRGVKSSTKIA